VTSPGTPRPRSAVEAASSPVDVVFTVNGVRTEVRVPALRRLLDVLRLDLGLTGSKEGCGEGECGACTVLVDGTATLSCLVPACQVDATDVVTIEGAGAEPIQEAFVTDGGAQCGICTPGMIVMTRAWLDACEREGRAVSEDGAREALAGNLCRCTGYGKILASVLTAARARGQPVDDSGTDRAAAKDAR
jgi:aerobic-type carbon monoxide dehydrogenase small subunit (CoxS/CutS family)